MGWSDEFILSCLSSTSLSCVIFNSSLALSFFSLIPAIYVKLLYCLYLYGFEDQ